MKQIFKKAGEGWEMLSSEGKSVGFLDELCFVADFKHGFALFPGSEDEVKKTIEKLAKRCNNNGSREDFSNYIRLISMPEDFDEFEASYMWVKCKLPKRVDKRLRKKLCIMPG